MTAPAGLAPGDEPVQWLTPLSVLGELEDFAAAMRAAGADRNSVIIADIIPSRSRRHAGFLARLGGYPHATRGGEAAGDEAARPGAGSAAAEPDQVGTGGAPPPGHDRPRRPEETR